MKKLMVLLLAALANLTALPLHADLASLRFFLTHPKRWNVILDEEGRGKISRTEAKTLKAEAVLPEKMRTSGGFWFCTRFQIWDTERFIGGTSISMKIKADPDHFDRFFALTDERGPCRQIDLLNQLKKTEDFNRVILPLNPNLSPESITLVAFPKNRESSFLLRNPRIEGSPVSAGSFTDTSAAVRPLRKSGMFYESEALEFQLTIPQPADFTVTDAFGKVMQTGKAKPGKLVLSPLPVGYYLLTLTDSKQMYSGKYTFSVVLPKVKMPEGAPVRFAVDTATCMWLFGANPQNKAFPGSRYEILMEICDRAGILLTRDRGGWPEPQKGKFDFRELRQNKKALDRYGIRNTGMIESSPKWAREKRRQPLVPGFRVDIRLLPDDLFDVYQYAMHYAGEQGKTLAFCEFWNEPFLRPDTMWEYAAAAKAAYLGVKAGSPETKMLSSSAGTTYYFTAMKNGLIHYMDAYNFHDYGAVSLFEKRIQPAKELLKREGVPNMAVLITENGWWNGEGPARCVSHIPNRNAHAWDQELIQTEYLVKSQLLWQRHGATTDYSFVLPFYVERKGTKDWGLTRSNASAKPALAAFSALSSQLGASRLLGTYAPDSSCDGMLFENPDQTQTLVLWKKSKLDTMSDNSVFYQPVTGKCKLNLPNGTYLCRNMFGTPEPLSVSSREVTLNVSNMPLYLTGNLKLKAQTPALPSPVFGAPVRKNLDKEIVYRVITRTGFQMPISNQSYAILQSDKGSFILEVCNFGKTAKSGTLTVKGGKVAPLPAEIKLEPMSKAVYDLTFTPDAGVSKVDIVICGTFNGKETTPCVVPLSCMKGLAEKPLPGWADLENWEKNSSGRLTMTRHSENQESQINFNVDFGEEKNHWVYPKLRPRNGLPQNVSGLRFEMKQEERTAKNGYVNSGVFLFRKDGGKSLYCRFTPIADSAWHTYEVFFPVNLSPDDYSKIGIGYNPNATEAAYSIRNVRFLCPANSQERN